MAVQDAKDFLDAVDQNSDLRAQVKGSFDDIAQLAQQNGYNVSKQELADEVRARSGITNPPPGYEDDPDTCFLGIGR